MLITTIGSSSGCSTKERDSAGVYIQTSKNILLDCGESTNKYFIDRDVNEIDIICITHAHVDHFIGLPMLLLHNLAIRGRTKLLKIIAPRTIMPFMSAFFTYYHIKLPFDVLCEYYAVDCDKQWNIDNILINAYPVKHSMDECYAYSIYDRTDDKYIFYTGDMEPCDIFVKDADIVIAEGTWASNYTGPRYGHSWVKEMVELVDDGGAKALILTHLSQKYHSEEGYRVYSSDVMDAFMECKNLKRIYIAYDGLEITL